LVPGVEGPAAAVMEWLRRRRPVSLRSWRDRLVMLGVLVAIELVYVFVISAGKMRHWPSYMAYYDLLADGFRAGHLHISLEPAPELLAQADPSDPRHSRYWLGDASLFGGHYYFYWGPLPGVILVVAKTLLRTKESIGDEVLVFGFFSVAAVASTVFLSAVRRRLLPTIPLPLLAASVLALGLGNPVLYLLASSSVYQAAISGGQAFLMAGLSFAFASSDPERSPTGRWACLALAGSGWAAALTCRLSLAPAIATLAAITLVQSVGWLRQPSAGRGSLWRRVIETGALLTPVVVAFGGLLVYNKLRFGAWLETGLRLQLTGWLFRFSARYILANLHQYLLRPPILSCAFPYAIVPYEVPTDSVVPAWMPFRDGYATPEPVAGMLWAFPLVWGIPLLLPSVFSVGCRLLRGNGRDAGGLAWTIWARGFLWCVAACSILSTLTMLAPLGLYLSTMRYLGDVRFGAGLLGVLGLWVAWARASLRWHRRVLGGLCGVLLLGTILIGLLLGYQGYTGHFLRFNPELAAWLQARLSLCR
jgi:hypothetical protein